jgi:serine/threonine protein kinase
MAPEQLEGHQPTAASDVYTLGLVAYEVLTGTPPFPEQNFAALIAAMLSSCPKALSALNIAVSRELDALVLKALDKDPSARQPTAGAFLEQLNALNPFSASTNA